MTDIDPLTQLLQAERAVRPVASGVDDGWHRLANDLAAHVAPLPIATGPLKLSGWLVPKWILTGFGVGLVGAGAAGSMLSSYTAPSPRAAHSAPATSAKSAGSPQKSASPASLALPPVVDERAIEAAPRVAVPAPSVSAPAPSAPFDAELKLIALAKAELDEHRPARASALLEAHAQKFPGGVFATEREALRVLALCEQGPPRPALAEHFAALHPASPLIPRLQRACHTDRASSANEIPQLGEPTTEPSRGE